MADLQHNSLPESQLHEPKGASLLTGGAADLGKVYVSDGSGSGTWSDASGLNTGAAPAGALLVADGTSGVDFLRHQGWAQYEDSRTTVGTPSQTIASGARTLWINDGGSSAIDKKPSDATLPMWDVATNTHVPITTFDIYHLRMSFTCENYAGATPTIEIELDIGGSIGTIYSQIFDLRKGGAAQRINMSFPVYTGSTYVANGGKFYLTYTGTGSCDIYRSSALIVRESKNYV